MADSPGRAGELQRPLGVMGVGGAEDGNHPGERRIGAGAHVQWGGGQPGRRRSGSPKPIPQPVRAGRRCLDGPAHRDHACATPDLDANVRRGTACRVNRCGFSHRRWGEVQRDERIDGPGCNRCRLFAQPAVDDVGVDALGQGHRRNRRSVQPGTAPQPVP